MSEQHFLIPEQRLWVAFTPTEAVRVGHPKPKRSQRDAQEEESTQGRNQTATTEKTARPQKVARQLKIRSDSNEERGQRQKLTEDEQDDVRPAGLAYATLMMLSQADPSDTDSVSLLFCLSGTAATDRKRKGSEDPDQPDQREERKEKQERWSSQEEENSIGEDLQLENWTDNCQKNLLARKTLTKNRERYLNLFEDSLKIR